MIDDIHEAFDKLTEARAAAKAAWVEADKDWSEESQAEMECCLNSARMLARQAMDAIDACFEQMEAL